MFYNYIKPFEWHYVRSVSTSWYEKLFQITELWLNIYMCITVNIITYNNKQ